MLDAWTLVHFLGWALATAYVRSRTGMSWQACLVGGLAAGLGWELLEPYTAGVWFGVEETVANRWFADPVADVAGAALGAWVGRPTRPSR